MGEDVSGHSPGGEMRSCWHGVVAGEDQATFKKELVALFHACFITQCSLVPISINPSSLGPQGHQHS